MKKCEIKPGMIIEDSDGILRVMILDTAISYSDGGIDLNMLDENLIGTDVSFDKIYLVTEKELNGDLGFWLKDRNILDKCTLIWQRKDQPIIATIDGIEYSELTLRSLIKKANEL
jgi:hypothetical protein